MQINHFKNIPKANLTELIDLIDTLSKLVNNKIVFPVSNQNINAKAE